MLYWLDQMEFAWDDEVLLVDEVHVYRWHVEVYPKPKRYYRCFLIGVFSKSSGRVHEGFPSSSKNDSQRSFCHDEALQYLLRCW